MTEAKADFSHRVRAEISKQLWIAVPMTGVNLVQFSIQLVSVMFVGHLGELDLSSASIATSFCGVTGYSFLLGLSSALETLCGQAYGARQLNLMGIFLQRSMLVLAVLALPIAILWLNVENVLLFFGQASDISLKAGVYARFLIPGLFAYALLQPLVRFLQTQSIVLPMFLCSATTLLLHAFFCWILIYKVEMGNIGAAIASSISNWLNVALLVMLVKLIPQCKDCWCGFSKEAFNDVIEFLKLAVPAAVMVCLEWWSFEALVLLSGVLPNPQLEASVFSILLNILGVCYMTPWGIGGAASTRVSNELGAGRPLAARFSFRVAVTLGLIYSALISTTLFASRKVLGKAFSNEQEVVNYVAEMVPILALVSAMDAIQGVISGVARGCGWQSLGALANLGSYYVVGLPIGYFLAFHVGFRGKGLLLGILCGVSTQAAALSIISGLTNWTKQAEAASKRVESSSFVPLLLD